MKPKETEVKNRDYEGGARGVNFNRNSSLGKILGREQELINTENLTHAAMTLISSLSGVRSWCQSIMTEAVPSVAARCIDAYCPPIHLCGPLPQTI